MTAKLSFQVLCHWFVYHRNILLAPLDRHIEGWVKVEFTIQTDGSVDNAVVVSSEPENIFDDAALTAISKWKFKEKMVNGVAVPQRAVQRLQFKLEH